MRILMATGGSQHSEIALHFGIQLAQRGQKNPTILTVIKDQSDRARAEEVLERVIRLLEPTVATVETKIRIGHPAEEIILEAEGGHYDLVIVGEKQHHRLVTRFLLGSTATRVVEHAPCPVIVAKGQAQPIRRILLCDSGAQDPTLLSRLITQLPKLIEGHEEITILHVMSQISAGPGVRGKQLRAEAEELINEHSPEGDLLRQDLQLLAQFAVMPEPKVRHGFVVDEILDEARCGEYDLVVIGANRGQGWRRILLDDLAHQIIVKVDRPVLVVR
jgi:nucleotide-binding universal stress UspA family protein